jgi:hypothetical protein
MYNYSEHSKNGKKNNTFQVAVSITKGRTYLEDQLDFLTDAYDLAIVTYALHLTNSTHKDTAYDKLMKASISGQSSLHTCTC